MRKTAEDYNVKFDFDWLQDIAEKAQKKGEAERKERFKNALTELAGDLRETMTAFMEAGFSEDQAFELLTILADHGAVM